MRRPARPTKRDPRAENEARWQRIRQRRQEHRESVVLAYDALVELEGDLLPGDPLLPALRSAQRELYPVVLSVDPNHGVL